MENKLPKDIGDKFIKILMEVIEEKFDVNIEYKIVEQEAKQLQGGQIAYEKENKFESNHSINFICNQHIINNFIII